MKLTALLHCSFLIADLGRSGQFYESVLGLFPNPNRPDLGFPGVWYDVGATQQIHLLQLPNPEQGLQRPLHGGRDSHVALGVNDLQALLVRLEQAGIPYSLSKSGRNALFCRDPDGNALEFIEAP